MSKRLEQPTLRRRRLVGALLGALLFHALLGLLPLPRFAGSWGLRGGAEGAAARGSQDGFPAGALRGIEVAVLAPPHPAAPAPPTPPPQAVPEPILQSEAPVALPEAPEPRPTPPQPSADDAATTDASRLGAAAGAATQGDRGDAPGTSLGEGPPGGGLLATGRIERELSPLFSVHPAVPEKVIRKRKIHDEVVLRLLVGTDGLVRDVEILRAIPNCEECNQSAIAAAKRHRYAAVMLDGRLVEVWTTFKFTFNDGR